MDSGAGSQLRFLHRQMYVDLIRAYLRDYGSQSDLARALGVTEAYLSFLLEPLCIAGAGRRATRWTLALGSSQVEIVEAFKFLKTPSEKRADQIASQLCTDSGRRDALRYHIDLARNASVCTLEETAALSVDQVKFSLTTLGGRHQVALFDTHPQVARAAYLDVWRMAASASGGRLKGPTTW